MAKIIYAVAGEGFGHSSRSHLIGQRFIDAGHDVMFVGSQKSLLYLKQYFGDRVKEIFGLSFAYDKGFVDPMETLKKNLMKLPEANELNDRLFKQHFKPFAPDLVISDFEPFSAWWAIRNRVPFISIDHEHMLTLCKLKHRGKNIFSRMTAGVVTESYYVAAIAYVILNFFEVPLKIDSAVLAPPIVRPQVSSLTPNIGEHILLYSTTGTDRSALLEILHSFTNHKFFIYGFDEVCEDKNCTFKPRSTEGFLEDLASSRAVIASAGFSLISECLHLRKKMLLLPLASQYEQILNAQYAEMLGMGISAEQLSRDKLSRFLDLIEKPIPQNSKILWPDNDKFFKILQQTLNKLHRPIDISLPK